MIKKILLITAVVFFAYRADVFSYNAGDTSLSFKYFDYDININSNSSEFFTGRFNVSKNGTILFKMDSTFSDYADHKFLDLNKDGSDELLVYLTDGASPYVFHHLYIFDHKKGPSPLFMVQNADVDTSGSGNPLILVNSKMSPAVLGLWYSWFLEYKNGKLVYSKPDNARREQLSPNYDFVDQTLEELKKEKQICDDFAYNVFFEYLFITSKISGEESKAENYFSQNYRCEEKVKALMQFKNAAADTYSWIKEEENYNYTEY